MVSKLEQHLGLGEGVEIDGDKFDLKPIGVQFFIYIKRMSKLMSVLEKNKDSLETMEESKMLDMLDEDSLRALESLVKDTIDESFPEEKPETRKQFAQKHMFDLLPKIIEINIPQKSHEAMRKKQALERLQHVQPSQV